jgi:processive 1,2-diacylglycerol beta-glucosyltransferase
MSLSEYLYGVFPPSSSQIHTNTYNMAYGKETIGLRVKGIPKKISN